MALLLTAELLRFQAPAHRAEQVIAAMTRAAASEGVRLKVTDEYRGGSDILMLWGPGHPARFEPMRQQLAAGGHVAALDLSYWRRETDFRVSIDAAHPQAWVMKKNWPESRWTQAGVPTANSWKADGPVIVAGLGRKARVQYGADQIDRWEGRMIQAVHALGRRVLYRRKQADAAVPRGVELASGGPIDQVLAGSSLLVTWHSNVAVDAIRIGIPAVCVDGAAAAVCPSVLDAQQRPLAADIRRRFLANLAWFQWGTSQAEALGCWKFLREVLA